MRATVPGRWRGRDGEGVCVGGKGGREVLEGDEKGRMRSRMRGKWCEEGTGGRRWGEGRER